MDVDGRKDGRMAACRRRRLRVSGRVRTRGEMVRWWGEEGHKSTTLTQHGPSSVSPDSPASWAHSERTPVTRVTPPCSYCGPHPSRSGTKRDENTAPDRRQRTWDGARRHQTTPASTSSHLGMLKRLSRGRLLIIGERCRPGCSFHRRQHETEECLVLTRIPASNQPPQEGQSEQVQNVMFFIKFCLCHSPAMYSQRPTGGPYSTLVSDVT